jgi:hypothetical protein
VWKVCRGEGKYLTIECPWCDWVNPSTRGDRIQADGRVRLYIPRWSKLDSCQLQKSIELKSICAADRVASQSNLPSSLSSCGVSRIPQEN